MTRGSVNKNLKINTFIVKNWTMHPIIKWDEMKFSGTMSSIVSSLRASFKAQPSYNKIHSVEFIIKPDTRHILSTTIAVKHQSAMRGIIGTSERVLLELMFL